MNGKEDEPKPQEQPEPLSSEQPKPLETFRSINEPEAPMRPGVTGGSINDPVTKEDLPDMPVPVISSLDPSSCAIGEPDFILEVHGENFFAESVIFFAGHDEPTTYDEEAGTLSTGVKPSLWSEPVVVQCQVRNGVTLSNAVEFTFAANETSLGLDDDPDAIEDELDQEIEDGDAEVVKPKSKKTKPKGKKR